MADEFCPCGTKLAVNPRRKGDLCQRCATRKVAQDPVKREKSRQAMKRHFAQPGVREAKGKEISKVLRRMMRTDPEFASRMRETGRRVGTVWGPKSGETAPKGSEIRKRAGKRQSQTALGDIPLEYRDEHRNLVKNHGVKSAESKRIIKAQVERDTERFRETGQLQKTRKDS